MTPIYSSDRQSPRDAEWEKLESQIRSSKDVLVIGPPLTGLTTFMHQVMNKIKTSEAYRNFVTVYIDRPNQFKEIIPELFDHIVTSTSPTLLTEVSERYRLQDGFLQLFSKNNELQILAFIDNLDLLSKEKIQMLFEHVRGISQSRLDFPQLNRIIFVAAGHSINLRRIDPKYISPFNAASIINIGDLSESESQRIVFTLLQQDNFTYSKLAPKYIYHTTLGHPYFVSLLCNNLNALIGNDQKLSFEKIDQAAEQIIGDLRDPLVKQIISSINLLDDHEISTLRKILNGARINATISSLSLEQLEFFGLISKHRGLTWKIRNGIFDRLIREHERLQPVIEFSHFMPRRLFVNLEGYALLYNLENDLRDFVFAKLREHYGNEWTQKINGLLRQKWEGLEGTEKMSNRFATERYPILSYALFPELYDLIEQNWKQIFHKYFKPKSIFTGFYEALEILRNKIAHNRPLRDSEIQQLHAIADRLRSCMYD